MKSSVLVALIATISYPAYAVDANTPPASGVRQVTCAPSLNPADDADYLPMVSVDDQKIEAEVQSLLDAFNNNQVRSIDIVTDYGRERNRLLVAPSTSQLMNGSMSGPGVDDSMVNLKEQMNALTKIMSTYSPEAMEPQDDSFLSKGLRLFNFGRNQARSITVSFMGHEQQIRTIIEGLGNSRAQLEVDNRQLDGEITRIQEKSINISTQIDLWKRREQKLNEFAESMQKRLDAAPAGSGEQVRLKIQLNVLKSQILLPVAETISMLQGRIDIYNAMLIALSSQQDQNKLVIRTSNNLEETASEVLPTIVTMAVTTARTGQVQELQLGTKRLMEGGLGSIVKQMDKNAQRQKSMMQEGPISAEKIATFRDNVIRIQDQIEADALITLAKINETRAIRDAAVDKQNVRVEAIKNRVTIGALPGGEDVRQITN